MTSPSSVFRAMVIVGVATAAWCAVAAPARATYGARVTADEPQYLLTALSLAEDRDLDIADELAAERWRDFHQAQLPEQTEVRTGGQRLSPHDPLLPVVLALPVGIGGWLGAKLTLAVLAGLLAAALLWVAARRLNVPPRSAAVAVLAFSLSAPFAAYGAQIYPEIPAALAVTVALGAATGPLGRRGPAEPNGERLGRLAGWRSESGVVASLVAVAALPWLGVKYTPVAAALAVVVVARLAASGRARRATGFIVTTAAAAAGYLLFHRYVYGGWTVYAAGDHFVGGEFTVAGASPDLAGRSVRLAGLLTDRSFGLAAWAPAWLVVVPAVAASIRRRPPGWLAAAITLAAGWLTATFVALTMHGWWWPGRQVVVVLPAAVLAVAWWVDRGPPWARRVLAPLAAFGVLAWAWVLAEVLTLRRRLIVDFDASANPLYRVWRWLLPDFRDPSAATWVRHGLWVAVFVALAVAGWRSIGRNTERSPNNAHSRDLAPVATTGPGRERALAGSGVR